MLDESTTDETDTLLLLFIYGVSSDFEVTEGLASVNSMHGMTTVVDIFREVEKFLL